MTFADIHILAYNILNTSANHCSRKFHIMNYFSFTFIIHELSAFVNGMEHIDTGISKDYWVR